MDIYPAGAPGAADRLRRHPRRHRRHQRRRPRPLPAQAVGSAGGEALPGDRRPARGVARRRRPRHAVHQGDRPPLERAVLGGASVPGPQPALVPRVHGRRAQGQAAARRRRPRRHAGCPVVITEKGETLVEPTDAELAAHARPVDQPVAGDVRPRGHRRRARRPGRRGVRRVRGPQDRADRAAPRPAGRPAAARGSRTTSASPTGVSGAELTTSARRQAERFGAEVITTREAVSARGQRRRRRARSSSTTAAPSAPGRHPGHRRRLPPAAGHRMLGRPRRSARATTSAAASSTARRCRTTAECEGEDVYIVGGANSAGQAAMYMSQTAKSVTLLVRGPSLEASMSLLPDPADREEPTTSRSAPAPRSSTRSARTTI